ncbi:MAG: TetR/AcrR family transcriptional regulator [Calditrichaeota bacterium]|nr:MAG: TetR/AcrR family transcriptional regulator [Calditrichota bacterium]
MGSKDDKRVRILKAAISVFARTGFYNAKVADIARQAGVASGTIYLYFKNKDEILISIFEEEMEKYISEVSKEVAGQADVMAQIRTFIKKHLYFVKKNPKLAQVFQLELRQSNKFIKEYTGTKLREYLNIVGGLIEEGQKQGKISSEFHPGLLKRAIFGALDEIATHWVLLKNGRYDLDESAEQIAELFLRGISATKPIVHT